MKIGFTGTMSVGKTTLVNALKELPEFKDYNFATGTQSISASLSQLTNDCITVIGGGDTVSAIETTQNLNSFTHVSTGGGASLKLLSGEKLDFIRSWEEYE